MNYMDYYESLRKKEGMIDSSLSSDNTERLKAVCEILTSDEILHGINKYPSQLYEEFKMHLSQKFAGKSFFLGSGSEDIIWKINTLLLKGKNTGVVIPNFYRIYETLINPVYISVAIEEKRSISSIKTIEQVLDEQKLEAIWIANPNPITGQCFEISELMKLFAKFPEMIFIVDEVSMDTVYSEESFSLLWQKEKSNNLIVLRSASKFYGIPGVRLGYASMNGDVLSYMLQNTDIFPVSGLSILIAEKLMFNQNYQFEVKKQIMTHREKLQELLNKTHILSFVPSQTNILLIKCMEQYFNLWNMLLDNNIISFSIEDEKGIEVNNAVRLTIPSGQKEFSILYDNFCNMIERNHL